MFKTGLRKPLGCALGALTLLAAHLAPAQPPPMARQPNNDAAIIIPLLTSAEKHKAEREQQEKAAALARQALIEATKKGDKAAVQDAYDRQKEADSKRIWATYLEREAKDKLERAGHPLPESTTGHAPNPLGPKQPAPPVSDVSPAPPDPSPGKGSRGPAFKKLLDDLLLREKLSQEAKASPGFEKPSEGLKSVFDGAQADWLAKVQPLKDELATCRQLLATYQQTGATSEQVESVNNRIRVAVSQLQTLGVNARIRGTVDVPAPK